MAARKAPKKARHRATVKDNSRRAQMELRLTIEHAVTRVLEDSNSISEAAPQVIRVICEALGWACGARWEPDKETQSIRCAETWGVASAGVEAFLEATRRQAPSTQLGGLNRRAWTERKPVWIPDVTKEASFRRAPEAVKAGLRSAFAFPIKVGAQVVGAMEFFSREIHQPDAELLDCTTYVGSQIGQFVQRKQAEEGLRRFRAAMDASADLMLLIDPVSLHYVDVNDAACRALGYTRQELLTMGPLDIFSTRREDLIVLYRRMIAGEVSAPTVRGDYRRKDGSLLPIEAYPRAVRSGNEHVIVSIARDITERLSSEETLRRFRVAMDNSADMIVLIDRAAMRFVDVNNTACTLLGYSREELLRMGPQDVLPSTRAELERAYDEFIADPSHITGMHSYYRRKDGSTFPFESTRHVLRSGNTYIIAAISRDISERVTAENALRASEERFRSLTVLSSDMYWEQDEQFRFTSVSGIGSGRVNKLTVQTIIGKKRWEQNYINMSADDWAGHIAALEAHQLFRDMELCRLDDSGEKVWISISGTPVFDSSGAFKGYRGVGKDITGRKADEARIQYLAHHDGLTDLPNRLMFSELLNRTIHSAQRYKRTFAVLFIDLDRFKIINDSLGHEAGDTLLKEMSRRLKECLRASDLVARLGGDEFVVLIEEVGDPNQVATVARKILSAAIKPMVISGQECRVTASIGICLYPAEAQDEQSLMKNADIAMYHAKEEGKNNYQFYSREIKAQSLERLTLETNLRRALERDEFSLHYQAKVNLQSGAITGVEALLRWQNPELGAMSPLQFIPLAEETGLIVPIGKWVLRTACAQNAAWQREGLPPVCIAVNLSARQFASEELAADVAAALADSGMKPELLELEITEGMVIRDPERAIRLLTAIKKLGVRLAIDDFGTGYSSLGQLKHFPIDTLKVDRSFIREIPQDAEDKAITEAIIAMGKTLGLTIVAEGVETKEQQTFLREHFCDEMQGYYFSKPVPSGAFADLLRAHIKG